MGRYINGKVDGQRALMDPTLARALKGRRPFASEVREEGMGRGSEGEGMRKSQKEWRNQINMVSKFCDRLSTIIPQLPKIEKT